MFKNISLDMKLLYVAVAAYAIAWTAHILFGTVTLHGFFGDAPLAFVIALSDSYVFNKDSNLIHLFSVGLPRDAQLLLNSLSLQAALWLNVRNMAIFKYAFVFWQYALPGFMYLLLFFVLWRNGKLAWGVFPLMSWAIMSVSLDVIPVNSARWALPIFWLHFFLVMFSGPRLRFWPSVGVLFLGALMWGGLYEAVMVYCGFCCCFGFALWMHDKNRIPFFYALAAVPGACRALLSFIAVGNKLPNSIHKLGTINIADVSIPDNAHYYYFFFIITCGFIAAIAAIPKGRASRLVMLAGLLFCVFGGIIAVIEPIENVGLQEELKFDYVFYSVAFMAWAGALKIWGKSPSGFAVPAATLALLAGAALWSVQSEQDFIWRACLANYDAHKGTNPVLIGDSALVGMIKKSDKIGIFGDIHDYVPCVPAHYTAWLRVLLDAGDEIKQWPIFAYWQDFEFTEKNGQTVLHTNDWNLLWPSVKATEADLPLKTLLYDLTPLYERLGSGPFIERVHCLKSSEIPPNWRAYYSTLDADQRERMHFCPSETPQVPHA